jgi:ligand-binding SRPBCC domain-containing protein
MKIHHLHREQLIPAPIEEVWSFFSNPGNLNEITPPDLKFEILNGADVKMYEGQLIEYRVEFVSGVRSKWLTEIAHMRTNQYFADEQRLGPYRYWYHEHIFEQMQGGVKMADRVTYVVPLGILGEFLDAFWIKRRLNTIFDYRHRKIYALFGHVK